MGFGIDELFRQRAQVWPEAATPVAHVFVRLFRLNALMVGRVRETVEAHGLSLTEFEVLAALRSAGPPHELLPSEISPAILISSGGLTKVLHALEAGGLIRRLDGSGDRRRRPVRLAARGRLVAEQTMAALLESDTRLLTAALEPNEITALARLLDKTLAGLEP